MYKKGHKHSALVKQKLRIKKIGHKNPQWNEENPSYTAVHKWLDRNFKKSKKCQKCGSSKFIEWALKNREKHTHDRKKYLCLCSSCHKKYDYTPERKKKLSDSLKKVVHTKEWCKKISRANKGRKLSIEHRRKISEYQRKNKRARDNYGRFI